MIPWSEVDGTNRYWDAVYPVDLQEHWLGLVENGPSMATWVLDSPMLELAHERQFVVSQQGGDSVEFEREHVERVRLCLTVLDQTFHHAAGCEEHQFYEPPDVEHVGLWTAGGILDVPTTLDLLEDEPMITPVDPPSPDRTDASLVAASRSSLHRSRTPAIPLYIEASDSEPYETFEDRIQPPSIRFSRARGDLRATQLQPTRALKSVRLRKRSSEKKKQASSSGVHKTANIQMLASKYYLSHQKTR